MSPLDATVDPVDADGRIKTAEECFVEAFQGSGTGGPTKIAAGKSSEWLEEKAPSWYLQKLISKYDRSWFEWEPETLWDTIERDFSVSLTEEVKNKINAVKLVHLTDAFWKEWNIR
jgi:hypothetical protein